VKAKNSHEQQVVNHTKYMEKALIEAHKSFKKDEVPVGCVIVDEAGKIIARAHNLVEQKNTQTAHAECLAITKAGKKLGDWRLTNCWLYVTLEPCAMCFHLAIASRLKGIVYGARSPLFGYQLDKFGTVSLYKDRQLPLAIIGDVCATQAAALLKEFFKQKRKRSEWKQSPGKQKSDQN
jgi:tRNA(adenine34) deaminase